MFAIAPYKMCIDVQENTWRELTTFTDYHYSTRRCFDLKNTPDKLIKHFINSVVVAATDSLDITAT